MRYVCSIESPLWVKICVISFVVLLSGCKRPAKEASTLRFKLPETGFSASHTNLVSQSAQPLSANWGLSDPVSFSDISCFAVFISAPDMPAGKCRTAQGVEVFSPGQLRGLYPAGSEVTIDTQAGLARTVRLVGLKASSSAVCETKVTDVLPLNQLSAPFVVGSVTLDLAPGTMNVDIVASLAVSGKFHSCTGEGVQFGPTSLPVASPPTGPTVVIDSGASSTTSTSVTLTLGAVGATEMYITNAAGCVSGGAWEPYSSSRAWTLAGTNSTQNVYVKYRNSEGYESSCVSDSIAHTVSAAVLAFSNSPELDFGTVAISGSQSELLTITNSGAVSATAMSGVALSAPFSFTGGAYPGTGGTCGATLAAAGNCTVAISFSPASGGVFTDTLALDYHDGSAMVQATRNLRGTGASPAILTISDVNPFDFGMQPVMTSGEHEFTVTNTGGVSATSIVPVAITLPFEYVGGTYPGTGGTCAGTLAAGANCTLRLAFSPTTQVFDSVSMQLDYFNGVSTQSVTKGLEGTGAPPPLLKLAMGSSHTCGIDVNGQGRCWGAGSFGQMGNGALGDQLTSVPISLGLNWLVMDSSASTNCGVTVDNRGYCWGENTAGQVGDNTTTDRSTPVELPGGAGIWSKIVLGSQHACGLRMDQTVQCWGLNTYGQLGNGGTTSQLIPTNTIGGFTYADIAAGGDTACGLTTGGQIVCWGRGNMGQVGQGSATSINSTPAIISIAAGTFIKVAVGESHACGIKADNSMICWGAGSGGQLGDGSATDAIASAVTVSGFWTQVEAGLGHTCGIEQGTGGLHCWGVNMRGQLGDGTISDRPTPYLVGVDFVSVFVGSEHTCGRKSNNTLWCWGYNISGQLGDGSTAGSNFPINVFP